MEIKPLTLLVFLMLAIASGLLLGWWGVMAVVAGGFWFLKRHKNTPIEESAQQLEPDTVPTEADHAPVVDARTRKRNDGHFADGLIAGMVLMDMAPGDDEPKKDSFESDHLEEDWMMTGGLDDGFDDDLDDEF